jgi:hypothetical protein
MNPADPTATPPPRPARLARPRRPQVLAALAAAAALLLIVLIVAAADGGSGTGPTPGPAATAATPVKAISPAAVLPVVYSQVEGWHGAQVRPAATYVGEGGAPYLRALKWSSWTASGAQAAGYLHLPEPGCTLPTYRCPYQRFRVKVQLSRVQTHDGARYYSRMRWTYTKNHARHVLLWKTDRGFWRT